MRADQTELLQCPACQGGLTLDADEMRGDLVRNGSLACSCGQVYPIRDGIVFLAIMDKNWATILKELIARREITYRGILSRPVEADRTRQKEMQEASVKELMGDLFERAAERIDFAGKPRILDIGAGECNTSAYFAGQGAEVFATETEVSNLKYLNFLDLFDEPAQSFEINGHLCHRRNPVSMQSAFSGIVCDVQRLPFRDGVFNIALCRSVLHHIERPGRAIREMLRTLRPDGRIIFISEPIRSVLDPESAYLEGVYDKEEGLNEHVPTLLHYLFPLLRRTRQVEVQYWHSPLVSRTKRYFNLLRYDYARHFWPGEIASGWRIAKLLFIGAAINLFARRNRDRIAPPGPVDARQLRHSIREVADIYYDYNREENLAGFAENTQRLRLLRLDLLNHESRSRTPERVNPANAPTKILEAGWREPCHDGEGSFRHTMNHASLLLGSPADTCLRLELEIANRGLKGPVRGKVMLDGQELGAFDCSSGLWERISFPADNSSRRRIHILEIRNDILASDQFHEGRECGVAVRSVRLSATSG